MFQATYRSSSGAPNCICSLWFIYTCGDRPFSSLDNGRSCLCFCAVCGRMSLPSVCMCVWSSRPGEIWSYDQISPGQEPYDIRPQTAQTHNERTSTESNLVTAQSTAHEPLEDGRKYGPKHVGKTLLKCF